MHGTLVLTAMLAFGINPTKCINRALGSAGITLHPLLQKPGDRGLGASYWTMEQQDAALRPVAISGGFDVSDKAHE